MAMGVCSKPRLQDVSEAPKVGGDFSGLISFIVLHIAFLNLVP
jgi:hypothetical protein